MYLLSASLCYYLTCQEENLYTGSMSQTYIYVYIQLSINPLAYLLHLIWLDCIFSWCSCGCRAYVYFSSPVPRHLLTHIKNDCSVVPRIAALREVREAVSITISFLYMHFLYLFVYLFLKLSSCRWIWSTSV